ARAGRRQGLDVSHAENRRLAIGCARSRSCDTPSSREKQESGLPPGSRSLWTGRGGRFGRLGRLDEPAVDQVVGSGYVAESLGGQQHNESRNLFGRSEAPGGDSGGDRLPDLVRILPRGFANRLRNPVFAKPEVGAD